MDHDVKAVSNVFYKLARADGKYLTNHEYQQLVILAQDLSMKTLGEPLWNGVWVESVNGRLEPGLWDALWIAGGLNDQPIRQRLHTRTRPIKEDSPAWKVIRAAWMQFDYEQRHAGEASNVTCEMRDNNAWPIAVVYQTKS